MPRVTRKQIAEQDGYSLRQHANFRLGADAVTAALAAFPQVAAIALIGSVARPLWRERSPFSPFRQQGIDILHYCKDVDLAVWLDQLDGLAALNRARGKSVQRLFAERNVGVAHHQVEIFIFRAGSNDYLGRLCTFSTCPKGKRECLVPGCGDTSLLRQDEGFVLWPSALQEDRIVRLYERGKGILQRAADLPQGDIAPVETARRA
jgi:hypothetical protein